MAIIDGIISIRGLFRDGALIGGIKSGGIVIVNNDIEDYWQCRIHQ